MKVEGRPLSRSRRWHRWCRRHPIVLLVPIVMLLVLAAAILVGGSGFLLVPTHPPQPVLFEVRPARSLNPDQPFPDCYVGATAWVVPEHMAMNEFPVTMDLVPLNRDVLIVAVRLKVEARQSIPAVIYRECADTVPDYTDSPPDAEIAWLPLHRGESALPRLEEGYGVNLIVQSNDQSSAAIVYVWRMVVWFISPSGLQSKSSAPFALIIPPA